MSPTEKEMKLIRLILNHAAEPGEISNRAIALIRSWRDRGVQPEDLENIGLSAIQPLQPPSRPDYGLCVFPWGTKFRGKQFKDIDPGYLRYQLRWIMGDPERAVKMKNLADSITAFLEQK